MKLRCKGRYSNPPAGLFFSGPGVIEVDDWKGEFLLRDAPENFEALIPGPSPVGTQEKGVEEPAQEKGVEKPTLDKMVKAPAKKK